ncbi:hypothetical protein [Halostreptopolyspora alba]
MSEVLRLVVDNAFTVVFLAGIATLCLMALIEGVGELIIRLRRR